MKRQRGKSPASRRGYALMVVLLFLVLMLMMTGVAQRHAATMLRVEQARALAEQRDEGQMHGMAKALELLETGKPPSDPYVCGTVVNTSQGPQQLTIRYESNADDTWTVRVEPTAPGDNPPPLPSSF